MKKIMFLFILIVIGCAPKQTSISESDVIETLEGFFEALDVENKNPNLIDDYVTQDFILYEVGRKMNKGEFLELVSGFPLTESDWELSDFRISTDINSAHISLFNTGNFILQTDSAKMQQKYEWLESAYMVKEEDKLKIKFYFSDNISVESDTIN
ncbi:MAG: hypothetical protein KAK04_20785 [Cyclobacteriaceae bacterium]|nr:hypothetical protein [Cyclobacteriaceae bacterium]